VLTWTYTVGDDAWRSVDLSYNSSSGAWTGDLSGLEGRIDFMIQAVDAAGNVGVSVSKGLFTTLDTAPAILGIDASIDPVAIGGVVSASAVLIDQPGDTHTATWDWGDGDTSDGSVVEPGFVSGEHTYNATGVYTVTLTVTDNDGRSSVSQFQYVVIYDPSAGFVTGGGWIASPEGAYTADPSLAGKATFGFVSKYKKGATVPTGSTEFQFKAGDLNFKSTSYEWMVMAGAKAQYKGFGNINGAGTYRFILTAIDGDLLASGKEEDKFRLKIWCDDVVVYDNQLDDPDTADPTTVLGGGSIVVHK